MARPKFPISPEAQNEINRFRKEIELLESGQREETDFKRFRLNNGIYGIRFKQDEHMIRIKLPYGFLTADQLDAIADIAAKYTPHQLSHVTTRQAIQLHNLKRKDVPDLLTELHEAGLTSREACGNTVRNISCDELAGIHYKELFDVVPYADLVFRYFLRNPICQNLPRKFKIAFESCPDSDRARIGIHDLGFRATVREKDGKKEFGFITTVGGGLGSRPFAAQLLEEFCPLDEILMTTEAVIRIFDRHGNRRDKNLARIKFVVNDWGIEKFRETFLQEKAIAMATSSGRRELFKLEPNVEEAPVVIGKLLPVTPVTPGFEEWKKSNVVAQKQKGFNAVYVRCLYGDLTPAQAHEAAQIAREFGGGRLRTSITQNIILRWIPDNALHTVFVRLNQAGLGAKNAQQIADITRCPGADTCNLAITHSKGLAKDLTEKVFSNGYADDPELQHISIKISGCINSCGQHHIGNIGFFGASRNVDGKQMPHYQILMGGRTGLTYQDVKFGERAAMIPARRISETVKHILNDYKAKKNRGESFVDWTDRMGIEYFRQSLAPFQTIDPLRDNPKTMFEDLGDADGAQFQVAVGKGECAA